MQKTRRYILEILKDQTESGVDDIVSALRDRYDLSITSVTVRHHLNILQSEGYIAEPKMQRRTTPGRPQYVYAIAPQAISMFPNNYGMLVDNLLDELTSVLPETDINVIFEGMADNVVCRAKIPDLPLRDKLDAVVQFLDQQGYEAHYEKDPSGFVLYTNNCPYHNLAKKSEYICKMDMRMISALLGRTPRKISNIREGDRSCSYLISVD